MSNVGSDTKYDVLILGGGLAGLTLAIQLLKSKDDLSICILEKNTHPAPEAAYKVGESTVEVSAHYFAKVLELEEHISESQLPKYGLRFFFTRGPYESLSDRLELGGSTWWPTPSYQLDRGRFENFLAQRATELGAEFINGARVSEISLAQNDTHLVNYIKDDENKEVKAQWVVDASGRAGLIKRKLDLKEEPEHHISSAWFRVSKRIDIDEWFDKKSSDRLHPNHGRRWLSTNHLLGEGYWVWIIPLASGSTSVGIVADNRIHPLNTYNSLEKSLQWLKEHEPLCGNALESEGENVQDFLALKNFSLFSKQVFSENRWALTGEAGVFLDPFYSPGSDFIAISNSFITDLILRDFSDDNFEQHARIYDELYLSISRNAFRVFTDQYQHFGHPQIMPLKILWDFAFYWSVIAPMFFRGAFWDLSQYIQVRGIIDRMSDLNFQQQNFFRSWGSAAKQAGNLSLDKKKSSDGCYIDFTHISYLYNLNQKLSHISPEDNLGEVLEENFSTLRQLACEISLATKAQFPNLIPVIGPDEGMVGEALLGDILPKLELESGQRIAPQRSQATL